VRVSTHLAFTAQVTTQEDVLDLIRQLPDQVNDASVTTELKFLTLGGVLWACHDEIIYLRRRVRELEDGFHNT